MDNRRWLERYSTDCKLKYQSVATQNNYISCVKLFLYKFSDYREPKEIPTQEIKEWLLTFATLNTRKHKQCAVNSFYVMTVGMPNKTTSIPYPKKEYKLPRIINQEETKRKILDIKNSKHKAILMIAYCCCLRVSEVTNLKVSDIDDKQNLVLIRQAKGGKDRYVKISDTTLVVLRDYYKEHKPKEYLFEGQFGGKYSTRSCEEIYHKYIDVNTSFHSLRHAGLTSMIEKGTNILAVQVVAGHKKPSTTAIYYHVSPQFLSTIPTAI